MLEFFLFIVGFILLIKGGNLLVEGSIVLAKKWKVSDLTIGLTIVSFGTSLPELVINVFSNTDSCTDIAIGNVLGSNIANMFLILGSTAIIFPLTIRKKSIQTEIPFSILATVLLAFIANNCIGLSTGGIHFITRKEGLFLLGIFSVFMFYVAKMARENILIDPVEKTEETSYQKAHLKIAGGMISLFIGGQLVVTQAIILAKMAGVSTGIMGLTVIALGTSLPEFVTSFIAARKQNSDLVIGNIIGSNIFNITWILGITTLVAPIPFNVHSNIDIIVVLLAHILFLLFTVLQKGKIFNRLSGFLFILFYALYYVILYYRI